MTEIFLPGPLGSAGALAAMIGVGEPQVSAVIAVLDGHRLHVDPDGLRLIPLPAPGSRIHGRLVAAEGEAAPIQKSSPRTDPADQAGGWACR